VTVALVLSGYALVELAAPGDYIHLLNSSVDRLLLQLWPTAVFTYFIIVLSGGGNRLTGEVMPWVAAEPGGDGVRTDDTAPFELPVRHTLLERGRHGDSRGERCWGLHECGRGRLPW
jgi:hypothetical protein